MAGSVRVGQACERVAPHRRVADPGSCVAARLSAALNDLHMRLTDDALRPSSRPSRQCRSSRKISRPTGRRQQCIRDQLADERRIGDQAAARHQIAFVGVERVAPRWLDGPRRHCRRGPEFGPCPAPDSTSARRCRRRARGRRRAR